MARRGYTRLPDYRLTSGLSQHSGRYTSPSSSSSSVLASRVTSSTSSSSYRLEADSSATTSAGRSLLGPSRSSQMATHEELDDDDLTESRASPKPNIRKYGRTTHSQAFSSSSAESRSASSPSTRQQRETPSWSAGRPLDATPDTGQTKDGGLGTDVHERRAADKLDTESVQTTAWRAADKLDTESVQTTAWRRRRADSQLGSEAQKPEVSSPDEAGRKGRRLESASSQVKLTSDVPDGVDEMPDSDRNLRRLRRQQRPQARDTPQSVSAVSQRAPSGDSKRSSYPAVAEFSSAGDRQDVSTRALGDRQDVSTRASGDRQDVSTRAAGDRTARNTTHLPAEVKIVVVAPDDDGSHQVSDVPLLDESPSPAAENWSGHVGQLATREWTEDDLDEFVRQLSNPQLTKRTPGEVKDPGRVRGVLTRAATEASSQAHDLDESFLDSEKASRIGDDDSKSSGLISGLSGLRLIKNRKMARTSQAHAKRTAMLKSRHNHHTVSSLLFPDDDDIDEATSSSGGDGPHVGAPHSCGSSPEGSDGEAGEAATAVDVSKDVKKGRFRKMLTRPLNRSQSAGCAKDVPAHARFLQKQQTTTKEAEWAEALKPRGSVGDIRQARHAEYNEEVDEEELGHDSPQNQLGRVHKTTSADSAMMLVDDMAAIAQLGATSQPKHKSRNIAKKISRKLFLRRRHTDSALGVLGKDEGARRLATVEPEEVKQWSQSFENLLFDKTGLELFRGFLVTEHSDENIEFWIACEHYKSAKSSKQLPSLAMKIFNDYVAVQSKREINLDSRTRQNTYQSVTSNPTRETFDEAQRRVQALMEKDSYRRFLESEIYQDLASGSVQHKS